MNRSVTAILAGALATHLGAQEGAIHNQSKVDICSVCDILKAPSKISCRNHHASTEDAHVTLAATLAIQWAAAIGKDWSIRFSKSPCEDGRKHFDASHDTCTIRPDAPARTYDYKVSLKHCKREGKGSIKVVAPTPS